MKLEFIWVSAGSANKLGLKKGRNKVDPTTCYIMTYSPNGCKGRCAFCPQNSMNHQDLSSITKNKLSRVDWPKYKMDEFLSHFRKNQLDLLNKFHRLCIQVLNYDNMVKDVGSLLEQIRNIDPSLLISSALPPISKHEMIYLKDKGLERIGIALDACTPSLFRKIKGDLIQGPYTWEFHWQALENAIEIFGRGYTTTHFIIGLGESEEEAAQQILNVVNKGILPGIFFFTPVKNSFLEHQKRIDLRQFRHIQIIRYLILLDPLKYNKFQFHMGILTKILGFSEKDLKELIEKEQAFRTAGCPMCNRPNYTSSPREEPDSFAQELTVLEKKKIFTDLQHLIST